MSRSEDRDMLTELFNKDTDSVRKQEILNLILARVVAGKLAYAAAKAAE